MTKYFKCERTVNIALKSKHYGLGQDWRALTAVIKDIVNFV